MAFAVGPPSVVRLFSEQLLAVDTRTLQEGPHLNDVAEAPGEPSATPHPSEDQEQLGHAEGAGAGAPASSAVLPTSSPPLLPVTERVLHVSVSPDGELLAVLASASLQLWTAGEQRLRLDTHTFSDDSLDCGWDTHHHEIANVLWLSPQAVLVIRGFRRHVWLVSVEHTDPLELDLPAWTDPASVYRANVVPTARFGSFQQVTLVETGWVCCATVVRPGLAVVYLSEHEIAGLTAGGLTWSIRVGDTITRDLKGLKVPGAWCMHADQQRGLLAIVRGDGTAGVMTLPSRTKSVDASATVSYRSLPAVTNASATCVAFSSALGRLAVGLSCGDVCIYRVHVTSQGTMETDLCCRCSLTRLGVPSHVVGAVCHLDWSPDGQVLACALERYGCVVWSSFGVKLVSTHTAAADSAAPFKLRYGTCLAWLSAGLQLACFGMDHVLSSFTDIHNRRASALSIAADTAQDTGEASFVCIPPVGRYLLFQQAIVRAVANGASHAFGAPWAQIVLGASCVYRFGNASRQPTHFEWQSLPPPPVYVGAHGPLRHAAISNDGQLLAVAGKRGVALRHSQSGRWKLFGDVVQEYAVACHLLALWETRCLLIIHHDAGNTHSPPSYTLIGYPTHTLDAAAVWFRVPLASNVRPVQMAVLPSTFPGGDACHTCVVMMCIENAAPGAPHTVRHTLLLYHLASPSPTGEPSAQTCELLGTFALQPMSSAVRSFHTIHFKHSGDVSSVALDAVIVSGCGQIWSLTVREGSFTMYSVSGTQTELLLPVPHSVWHPTDSDSLQFLAYWEQGMHMWNPACSSSTASGSPDTFKVSLLPADAETCPLAVRPDIGSIVGVRQTLSTSVASGHELDAVIQAALHLVVWESLTRDDVDTAQTLIHCALAKHGTSYTDLCMKWLLRGALDAAASRTCMLHMLAQVVVLLQSLPNFVDIVSETARMMEGQHLDLLFKYVGQPFGLFLQALHADKLLVASNLMLLLQEWHSSAAPVSKDTSWVHAFQGLPDGIIHACNAAVMLFQACLTLGDRPLALQVVQFVRQRVAASRQMAEGAGDDERPRLARVPSGERLGAPPRPGIVKRREPADGGTSPSNHVHHATHYGGHAGFWKKRILSLQHIVPHHSYSHAASVEWLDGPLEAAFSHWVSQCVDGGALLALLDMGIAIPLVLWRPTTDAKSTDSLRLFEDAMVRLDDAQRLALFILLWPAGFDEECHALARSLSLQTALGEV